MRLNILNLGLSHIKNQIAETLYLYGNRDFTRPITIFALVNERCNSKCLYCGFWERDENVRVPEMSIDQWKTFLLDLKGFTKNFSINFSGGEPLLKKDFLDLLAWCGQNNINAGFTTNGSLFTKSNIKKTIMSSPFNVNISIDSHIAQVHDTVRGFKGNWEKASLGIRRLRDARDEVGKTFPIIVKPTIHNRNHATLGEIVDYALSVGATSVNFQPIENHNNFIRENFWIEPDQYQTLQKSVARLIELKRAGTPILNSESNLNLLIDHFKEKKADRKYLPCRVGLRNLFIKPNGDSMLCWKFPDCGNVVRDGAKGIWLSKATKKIRKQTVECQSLCLLTCTSQKTLVGRLKMAAVLFGSNTQKHQ